MRRVEVGAAPPPLTAVASATAIGGDRRGGGGSVGGQWSGAHAWRTMTLTPGEVAIYSSFMNNARPETRRRLYAAGDRLSADNDVRPRLQKFVTMQNQRQFLASKQPAASVAWLGDDDDDDDGGDQHLELQASTSFVAGSGRGGFARSAFVSSQAARTLAHRASSWAGLSTETQFRATRAIRKMVFSARRRAAGSSRVVPAESFDLYAGRTGGGGGRRAPQPRARSPSRRLGDVSSLATRAPIEGVRMAQYRNSHQEAETRYARDRTAAAVASAGAAAEDAKIARPQQTVADGKQAAHSRSAVASGGGSSAAAAALHSFAKAASGGTAAGGGRDATPTPPSNTPDIGDLDALSLHSDDAKSAVAAVPDGGGSGGGVHAPAPIAARRIEVYMPAMAT